MQPSKARKPENNHLWRQSGMAYLKNGPLSRVTIASSRPRPGVYNILALDSSRNNAAPWPSLAYGIAIEISAPENHRQIAGGTGKMTTVSISIAIVRGGVP